MKQVVKLVAATATDADAAYVLARIAEIARIDADLGDLDGNRRSRLDRRSQACIESGRRLIGVHKRLRSDEALSGRSKNDPTYEGWYAWLRENGIPRQTADRHMKLAGWTEEQTEQHRKVERTQKSKKRSEIRVTMQSSDGKTRTVDGSYAMLRMRISSAIDLAVMPDGLALSQRELVEAQGAITKLLATWRAFSDDLKEKVR